MNRNKILENRKKVIAFLKDSSRQKHKGSLENIDNTEERCCLGHMCAALNIQREAYNHCIHYDTEGAIAPESLVNMVGLNGQSGTIRNLYRYKNQRYLGLTDLNDHSDITPQEIGAYLESVIEGGPNSPWRSLNEYTE